MLKDFDQHLKEIRVKISSAGLRTSSEEKIAKRLNYFEENSRILHDKSLEILTTLNNFKFDCEQIFLDAKKLSEWTKSVEQELNRFLPMNLNSAEEKSSAAKKLLVNFSFFVFL